MAAKVSQEMKKARIAIEGGATPYRAAKDNDLTVSAITRSQWYKDFVAAQPEKEAGVSPMERARKMVEVDGKTAYEAAKVTGVAQSSISRAPWYREHIAGLVDDFKPGGKFAC